jgi:predicted outer membrane repeat protein
MNPRAPLLCLIFILIISVVAQGDTIYVPDDYPTIQEAIDASENGDSVVVRVGTYAENINFLGKAIRVMGEQGADKTFIGGTLAGSVVTFANGEGTSSILEGFTLTNGDASYGGGIYCQGSSPTIRNNTITGNSALGGGGIACFYGSSPKITVNTITKNSALHGGGIYCNDASPITFDNAITNNSATRSGGGISCSNYSAPAILNNTFTGNSASKGGGIACLGYSSPFTINTVLWQDDAPIGQEIYVEYYSTIVVTYSDIEGGWPGMGNIDADPTFVFPTRRDYRLLWGSPCIDSGRPDSLLLYISDPDGTRRDMGAFPFDQRDHLTLYLTPDTTDVVPGGHMGINYTIINPQDQPELFWGLSQVILPNDSTITVLGPDRYKIPANTTIQQQFIHGIPPGAPPGYYEYWSRIGFPPSTPYDEDRFTFTVLE